MDPPAENRAVDAAGSPVAVVATPHGHFAPASVKCQRGGNPSILKFTESDTSVRFAAEHGRAETDFAHEKWPSRAR